MRCELFEELIPLHVGGDLEPPEADELRQHLNSCAHCRQLHEEFQASQNWLSGFAVPKFEEASFANLRTSVLSEIQRQEKRGSWINWLLPKWNPRQGWGNGLMLASATIALAITTGLIAMVYRQKTDPVKPGGENIADARQERAGTISTATGRERSGLENNQAVTAHRTASQSKHLKTASPLLPPEAFTNGGFSNALEPPVIPEESAVAESVAPAQPEIKEGETETLRIEIQTADPNIRIIWLTPKADSHTNSIEK